MLQIEGLRKTFNAGTADEKRAIDDLDLHLASGDFVTVIGSNGAGKSTLLNLIAGSYTTDQGEVHIDGERVTGFSECRRAAYLGRIFQDPLMGTAASMTIEENLAMAELRGKPRGLTWGVTASRRAAYRQRLSRMGLGLESRLKQPVSLLSGGQRQSLTLLMATLHLPKVLLLDEHTAALDPKTARTVMALTEQIITDNHLTALMVTHNMRQAIHYGNRMIMLHEGRIQFDVSGQEKAELTVQEVVARFGGTLNDEALLG
ncbi:MAG: ABC transporter ATP-binding protein [Desulfosarcinaceae bacterium]|nr:ABC transporter ATP-binding protein [Desulfosarcinaceae bacterium]